MRKKILIVVGVVLLLLIITNPSLKAFRDFNPSLSTYSNYSVSPDYKRSINCFIFSVYKYVDTDHDYSATYLGIAGNFIKIGH